jgi:cytochrome c oxidase subunit 2
MDRYEKLVLQISTVLMLVFAAGVAWSVFGLGVELPTCLPDAQAFTRGELIKHADHRYELHYLAKMWMYEPAEVEIPKGSTVDIYLTSADVVHGFNIIGTNINLMAVPGAMNRATLTLDKAGTYQIVCHEYCGLGHAMMAGKIKVTEE